MLNLARVPRCGLLFHSGKRMKRSLKKILVVLLLFPAIAFASDPLPSWNEGKAK